MLTLAGPTQTGSVDPSILLNGFSLASLRGFRVFGRFGWFRLVLGGFSGFQSVSVWFFFVGFGRGIGRFFVLAAGFQFWSSFSLFRLTSGFGRLFSLFLVGFGGFFLVGASFPLFLVVFRVFGRFRWTFPG